MKNKHLHLARRKMSHVIDEIYTALLRTGGGEVQLRIIREEEGLRLLAAGDFSPENQHRIQRMAELLQPVVRTPALVEEFWELAGGDQYTSESELALVGQIIDQAAVTVEDTRVEMDLFISY